jgi:6-phosphogluconolactonase (cycloisomerase 2 family)
MCRKERDTSRGSPRSFAAQGALAQDDIETDPLPTTVDVCSSAVFLIHTNEIIRRLSGPKNFALEIVFGRGLQRMRLFVALLVAASVLNWAACSTGKSTPPTGNGGVFVATQGDNSISGFLVDLGAGKLSANGKAVATGSVPAAIAVSSAGDALFVANSGGNDISAYMLNSDGTLTAASGTTPAGQNPVSMAVDTAGHLFVANQGTQSDPTSATISVFSVSGDALTEVSGSPFPVSPGALTGPGPAAVAATSDGKFLYVANKFDSTIVQFSASSDGTLTRVTSYLAGTTPAAVAIVVTSDQSNFLYVANSGSNNVSAYAICTQVNATCGAANGTLTEVTDSPFPAGLKPVSIAASADGAFLYVADKGSNQVSQYQVSAGSGALAPLSQAAISTGSNPVWVAVRAGSTTLTDTGGIRDFVYTANQGANSISVFSFDSTVGTLSVVGQPVTTGGQPSALAAR